MLIGRTPIPARAQAGLNRGARLEEGHAGGLKLERRIHDGETLRRIWLAAGLPAAAAKTDSTAKPSSGAGVAGRCLGSIRISSKLSEASAAAPMTSGRVI